MRCVIIDGPTTNALRMLKARGLWRWADAGGREVTEAGRAAMLAAGWIEPTTEGRDR